MIPPIQVKASSINNFIDNKTSGMIEVCKDFIDAGTRSVIPDIRISSKKPSKNPLGYSVTFHSGDGEFSSGEVLNQIVYSSSGNILFGSYEIPEGAGLIFDGWLAGGAKVGWISDDGIISQKLDTDIDVYASYRYMPKYAVSVYDIEKDVGEDGNILGITFGPALGENYVKDVVSHEPYGKTQSGNDYRCIHNDSWSTVVEWNTKDPYVYEQCIRYGCSHSVLLNIDNVSHSVVNKDYNVKINGDGTSCLSEIELGTDGVNSLFSSFSAIKYSESRVRALLNGVDDSTVLGNDSKVTSGLVSSTSNAFRNGNNLFETLPDVLKNSIRPRLVCSYDSKLNGNYSVYDRLWLLSRGECEKDNNELGCSTYRYFKYNRSIISFSLSKNTSGYFSHRVETRFIRDSDITSRNVVVYSSQEQRYFNMYYTGKSNISFGFTLE